MQGEDEEEEDQDDYNYHEKALAFDQIEMVCFRLVWFLNFAGICKRVGRHHLLLSPSRLRTLEA